MMRHSIRGVTILLILLCHAIASTALCPAPSCLSFSRGSTRPQIARWRGGAIKIEESAARANQPLMSLKLGLVRVAGYSIIAGSLTLKAPQIVRVIKNRSVLGLAPASIYSDVFLFTSSVLYHALRRNPFRAYGESIFILMQTFVMVGLFWRFEDSSQGLPAAVTAEPLVTTAERASGVAPEAETAWGRDTAAGVLWKPAGGGSGGNSKFKKNRRMRTRVARNISLVGAYAAAVAACLAWLPQSAWGLLICASTPAILGVQLPQIMQNFQQGHTGELAPVTVLLSFLGSGVRVATTVADLGGDPWLLMNYLLGTSLNGVQLTQLWAFRKRTREAQRLAMVARGGRGGGGVASVPKGEQPAGSGKKKDLPWGEEGDALETVSLLKDRGPPELGSL
ncbi:unnamed protein product [Discosporangium mesarthrocarpum]